MFETEFTQMLTKYRDVVAIRSRFSGLVKDYFPGQQRQINLLLTAYDLGIAAEISSVPIINHAFAFRFVKRLTDEYGISRVNADWAVSMWCVCYGKHVLQKPCEIKLQTEQKGPVIVEEKTARTQYGDLFQYEKLTAENGLSVTGFTGDKKQTIIFQNQYRNQPVIAIKEKAFQESELEQAVMTDGIKTIGNHAFAGCHNLHQVIFPMDLQEIGSYGFAGCKNLRTITLPEMLEQLGDYAFYDTGLKAVQIPKTLYWLGEGAFSRCTNIETIEIPENINIVPDRLLQDCASLKRVNLHEQISAIGAEAFAGCCNLMELYVPESVHLIGANAFSGVHDKFILLCPMGSYAESYARANKLNYQLV